MDSFGGDRFYLPRTEPPMFKISKIVFRLFLFYKTYKEEAPHNF